MEAPPVPALLTPAPERPSVTHPDRVLLPPRRKSVVTKVKIGLQSLFLTYGLYPDGRLGEIFLDMSRWGSALREWLNETARSFSMSIQYGVPLPALVKVYKGTPGDPRGRVEGYPQIESCTSVMDFVARAVELEFVEGRG